MNSSEKIKQTRPFFRRMIIETSGICNLRCKMCPTLYYDAGYKNLMSDRLFDGCLEYIRLGMEVILTGWGEPLLDPHLAERIQACKKRGATVYIASNGLLLNQEAVHSLLEAGLDGISFSMDAGTKEVYESIRRGSSFKTIVSNIRYFAKARENFSADVLVDASFVTMKSNIRDLKNFILLAEDMELNMATVTPKYLSFSERDKVSEYIAPEEIKRELDSLLEELRPEHCQIRTWALDNERPENDCLAEGANTVFIAWDGNISACCNLGHPAPRYLNRTGEQILPYNIFGNLEGESMQKICQKLDYVSFRNQLKKKIVPPACRGCPLF